MTEPIPDLGPDARAALQALKADHALEPQRHRAVLQRIESSIGAGAADPGGRVDALLAEPGQRRPPIPVWTWAIAAAAAVVLAIWGFQSVTATEARHDPRSNPGVAPYEVDEKRIEGDAEAVRPKPVPRSVPAPRPMPEAAQPEPEPEVEPDPVEPEPAPVVRRRPAKTPSPSPERSGLGDEMALMRQARSALEADDPTAALRALELHAKRHGSGQLVEDRRALQIIALCELGKLEQAKKKAAAFGREFPQSHYKRRIASCLEKSSTGGDGSE